jgi:hypothetical protein
MTKLNQAKITTFIPQLYAQKQTLNINTVQVSQTNNSTQFYNANHHYLMKTANYKKYQEKQRLSKT